MTREAEDVGGGLVLRREIFEGHCLGSFFIAKRVRAVAGVAEDEEGGLSKAEGRAAVTLNHQHCHEHCPIHVILLPASWSSLSSRFEEQDRLVVSTAPNAV